MRRFYSSFALLLLASGSAVMAQPAVDAAVAVKTKKEAAAVSGRVGVAQDQTLPLTMSEAIRLAIGNNNEIDLARDDIRVSEARLRSAEGIYDPVITASSNFRRNSYRGLGSYNTFDGGIGYFQPLRKNGATFAPIFRTSRDAGAGVGTTGTTGTNGALGQSLTSFSTLGATFTQPLFRNRKIDNNRRIIRIRKKEIEQSDADFRLKAIEKVYQVQQAYWDLSFALTDQRNRIENLNLSKENLRKIEMQIEDGAEPPLAQAEVETELANREVDVYEAERRLAAAENRFKQLVLKDMNAAEWGRSVIPTDRPTTNPVNLSLTAVVADAINNRPELTRLKRQAEISEIEIEYFRNQKKPQVDLNTAVSLDGISFGAPSNIAASPLIDSTLALSNADAFLLRQLNLIRNDPRLNLGNITGIPSVTNGLGDSPVIGGTGRSIRNLLSPRAANFSVGVTVSFPFKNKIAEAELARTEIEQKQVETRTRLQELQVYTEVRNAVQNVESSSKKLLSARKARENAEIQLQGERDLFDSGRSSRFLLFQRENTLANARTAEAGAQIDYNKALSELQLATSTTLKDNNIDIGK